MQTSSAWTIAKTTLDRFRKAEGALLAASLSHFGTLAIIPFLMVGAGLMVSFGSDSATQLSELGTTEAYESFARPVRAFLPFIEPQMAADVRSLVRENAWTGLAGYLALFVTASLFGWGLLRVHMRIFGAVKEARFLAERLLVSIFLLAALVLAAVSSLVWHGLDLLAEGPLRDSVFSTIVLALGFLISLKWFGGKRIRVKPLLAGVVLFSVAWQVAMVGFAHYVESRGFYATYGTLGGVACVMVWLYYASTVYLISSCLVATLNEDGSVPGVESAVDANS
jgi:uncharacterized BrkB/YihY/UPF0761 family membrane protein